MKVAYVLRTNMAATYPLATMILPQLEQGIHGADVVGMMFFDDNLYCLREGDPVGERLAVVAEERGILL
ncbi:MAG: sulfur reduction protein DsrE, partial [Gemmatimonadota bacterium]